VDGRSTPADRAHPDLFNRRLHLIQGNSPEALDGVGETVDVPFDLLFMDGLHLYDEMRKDLEACSNMSQTVPTYSFMTRSNMA
jgi:hypothetical protein